MANTPDYYPTPALEYLTKSILNPTTVWNKKKNESQESFMEWVVAAWAATMLKKVFSDDKWIIIPERSNEHTRRRPDITVQNMETPHLLYEVKSSKGDRLVDALFQTIDGIPQWVDSMTDGSIYIIIQRGCKIAFFEYHNNTDDLDHHKVPHIKGCISLTQRLWDVDRYRKILDSIPDTVLPLYHDFSLPINNTEARKAEARKAARDYKDPCVFDIQQHQREINFLFHHILTSKPREGPFEDESYPEDEDEDEDEAMDMD